MLNEWKFLQAKGFSKKESELLTLFMVLTWWCPIAWLLRPGQQVYAWDVGAKHQGVFSGDEAEGVLGDAGDACVLADDAGQGGGAQRRPLAGGEHARVLVPQPVHGKQN